MHKQTIQKEAEEANFIIDTSIQNQLPYRDVSKLKNAELGQTQLPYIHVSKYVSTLQANGNFFKDLAAISNLYENLKHEVTRKLIFLTLHTTRVYSGLAKKSIKIQDLQFQRQIKKLQRAGIFEEVKEINYSYDPFLRWVKDVNPNINKQKLKLYKLNTHYTTLFSQIEHELEKSLDPTIVDTIRHYRSQIKRTHRDVKREKKQEAHKQKKLSELMKKDIFSKLMGICSCCSIELYYTAPSRVSPQAYQNYRMINQKPICHECASNL